MTAQRVLGLFAKKPTPGQVKTRLAAETSPAWAAQVARAFLCDSLERLSAIRARRVLVYSPGNAKAFFSRLAGNRFILAPQGAGNLGGRMRKFFSEQRKKGAGKVVLLGTDSPTLPLDYIEQAYGMLGSADLVLGPATDGGYYLVGCSFRRQKNLPPIFEDIPWGSSRVLAETVARLRGSGWRLALLPPWYDVDTLDDWHVLQGHLAALRQSGVDPNLPHTIAVTVHRILQRFE